jgi:hypothetical protein
LSLSSDLLLFLPFPDWRIDRGGGWLVWRIGRLFDGGLGVGRAGEVQDFLAGFVDCFGLILGNLVQRHQSDCGVVMIAIVPVDKTSTEDFRVFDTARLASDVTSSSDRRFFKCARPRPALLKLDIQFFHFDRFDLYRRSRSNEEIWSFAKYREDVRLRDSR